MFVCQGLDEDTFSLGLDLCCLNRPLVITQHPPSCSCSWKTHHTNPLPFKFQLKKLHTHIYSTPNQMVPGAAVHLRAVPNPRRHAVRPAHLRCRLRLQGERPGDDLRTHHRKRDSKRFGGEALDGVPLLYHPTDSGGGTGGVGAHTGQSRHVKPTS